jgi:hypothetical protein
MMMLSRNTDAQSLGGVFVDLFYESFVKTLEDVYGIAPRFRDHELHGWLLYEHLSLPNSDTPTGRSFGSRKATRKSWKIL